MSKPLEIKLYAQKSDLKSRSLSILMYLVDKMDNVRRTCFPSIATIGKQLHISVSTVKRSMKELFEKGFLKREARFVESKNGGQTSNLYTVSTPKEQKEFVRKQADANKDVTEEVEVVTMSEPTEIEAEEVLEAKNVETAETTITQPKKVEATYISFTTIMAEKGITKNVLESAKQFVHKLDRKAIWKEE
ncbi:MAG: helix-turn-helix domain-containing protein [Lachnospiraceae bacterium]